MVCNWPSLMQCLAGVLMMPVVASCNLTPEETKTVERNAEYKKKQLETMRGSMEDCQRQPESSQCARWKQSYPEKAAEFETRKSGRGSAE